MSAHRPLLIAVLLGLAAAGCGTRTAPPAPGASAALSPAAYRSAASRTCASYRRQVADLRPPSTVAGLRRYVIALRRLVTQRIAELRRLRPPAAMSGAVRAMDTEAGPLVGALDRLAAAIHTGASPRVAIDGFRAALARLAPRIDTRWKALGVPACEA